jgi:hypothetical protein
MFAHGPTMFPQPPAAPNFPGPLGPMNGFPGAPMFGHPAGYQSGYQIGVIVGALFVGVLCGLAPLLIGQNLGQQTLGIVGMAVTVLAGLLLGLLGAVRSAVIFTVVILVRRAN